MKNTQSYLNWFVYLLKVKLNKDKYPITQRIIHHLLLDERRFTRESGD